MASYTKIDNFLGGVFTLKNGVRKNDGPHGGNWPPLGTPWGPMGAPMGAPISKRWGNFPPWGPQWQMMGESNMPMGEINGHPDELCTMLSYKTSGPIVFPHGVKRYTYTVLFCVWMYNSITYRECRCFEGRATFNFWCQPATISVHPIM